MYDSVVLLLSTFLSASSSEEIVVSQSSDPTFRKSDLFVRHWIKSGKENLGLVYQRRGKEHTCFFPILIVTRVPMSFELQTNNIIIIFQTSLSSVMLIS